MNSKILLIFLLFHYLLVNSIDPSTLKLCEGQLCTSDCSNCNVCDPKVCKPENNCQCYSQEIPGNLPLEDTPQFFFLTFDDILEKDTLYDISKTLDPLIKDEKIKDGLGCAARPTFYVQSLGCQYALAPLYEKKYGGEIALHSVTHTTSSTSSDATWKTEIGQCYKDIRDLSSVKNLYGFRAPYLEVNDYYYKYLIENKILYDSSSSYYGASWRKDKTAAEQRNYWPFTLDYGFPDIDYCYSAVSCPTKSIPGIWEITMIGYVNSQGKEYVIMDYDYTTIDSFVADLKSQIQKNYDSNRAPLGLYFHSLYFLNKDQTAFDPNKYIFLQKALQMVSETFPKLVFTTPARVINWMKNPKKFSELQADSDFTCVPRVNSWTLDNSCNDDKPVTTCPGSGSYLSYLICGQYCPNSFPNYGVNWDYSGGTSRSAQTTSATTTTIKKTATQSSSSTAAPTSTPVTPTATKTATPSLTSTTTKSSATQSSSITPSHSSSPTKTPGIPTKTPTSSQSSSSTMASTSTSSANPTTSNTPSSSTITPEVPTQSPTSTQSSPSTSAKDSTTHPSTNPTTSSQTSSSPTTPGIPTETPTSTSNEPTIIFTRIPPSDSTISPEKPTETPTSTTEMPTPTPSSTKTEPSLTAPPEKPTGTPEMPPGTPEMPTGTPEMPTGTPEMPTRTHEMPTGTYEMPTGTPETHTGTPEMPTGTPEMPIETPEIPKPTKPYTSTTEIIPNYKPTPTPILNPGESLVNDLVKFEFVKQKSNKNSFCGSLIVNLEKVRNVNSAIFTFAFCEKMGTMDLLYSVYRNQKFQKLEHKQDGIRMIKAIYKDMRIKNTQKIEMLSFCISGAPAFKALKQKNSLNEYVRIGGSLTANNHDCLVQNKCRDYCGDGICSKKNGEDRYNCPVDCDNLNC